MNRWIYIALILLSFTQVEAKNIALLIGVSSFEDASMPSNNACNDIDTITTVLNNFDIISLEGEKASKYNVMLHLDTIKGNLQDGDTFLFYYSGIGDRKVDINGDENDGFDETLFMYDTKKVDGKLTNTLLDDEIGNCLNKYREILGSKGKVVMFIDACFSGTIQKGGSVSICRGFYDEEQKHIEKYDSQLEGVLEEENENLSSLYVCTASVSDKYAYETSHPIRFRKQRLYFGVFTLGVCQTIDFLNDKQSTFEDFCNLLSIKMNSLRKGSKPYLSCYNTIQNNDWVKELIF